LNLSGSRGVGRRSRSVLSRRALLNLVILHEFVSERSTSPRRRFIKTYTPSAPGTASTTTTAGTAAATSGVPAAGTLTLTVGTLGLLTSRLGLAGKLDGHLALKNLLAGELGDGALSLCWRGEVDEGVADGTVGARVLGNGNRLTVAFRLVTAQARVLDGA